MRKMSEIGFLRNLGFDVEEEDGLTRKEGGGLNFSTREELRGQYPPSMIHPTAKTPSHIEALFLSPSKY